MLKAHQKDIGPDLLKSMIPTAKEFLQGSCLRTDRKDGESRDMVIGHHGEDLHLPEEDLHPLEDLYPLEEDLYPLEGPHTRGTHQRGEARLEGGTHLGGGNHRGRETHQGGGNHRGRETHQGGGIHQRGEGTPQGGGIGQDQGHLQENMIDIEGDMIDLGQGLPTQGITTDDLQEGIHRGADHPHQAIGIVHQEDIGHHLPTGRLDWVSLERICSLQDLAMPSPSEIWRRNFANLDV